MKKENNKYEIDEPFLEVNETFSNNLEERTLLFAKNVRLLIKNLPANTVNIEDGKQVVRSSASVGANYIESREPLGLKDCLIRLCISRKEAKESAYFLKLISATNSNKNKTSADILYKEAYELIKILSAIIIKVKNKT